MAECGLKGKSIKKWEERKHREDEAAIRPPSKLPSVPFEQTDKYRSLHHLDHLPVASTSSHRLNEAISSTSHDITYSESSSPLKHNHNIGTASANETSPSGNIESPPGTTDLFIPMDIDANSPPPSSPERNADSQFPTSNEELREDWHLDLNDMMGGMFSSGDEMAGSDVENEEAIGIDSHSSPEPSSATAESSHVLPNTCMSTPAYPTPQEKVYEPLESPADVLADASPYWFWRIILIVTTYLHLHYHLPHRACTLLLKVLSAIFVAFRALEAGERVPVTLTTTFNRLNLGDNFSIYPLCPLCKRVYPADNTAPKQCTVCKTSLFSRISTPVPNMPPTSDEHTEKRGKAILQSPIRTLSSSLVAFLNRPGIEDAIDEWRSYIPENGKLKTMMDGEVWKSIKGHDGKLFFDNSPDRENSDELWIGITQGFDG